MNPALYDMILKSGHGGRSHGGSADALPGFIALGIILMMAALLGWSIYDRSQWETVAETNVWLRVGAVDGTHRFTPALVDDATGQVFREQIGPKTCSGGPTALPLGASILANVETLRDRRDGRVKRVLDTRNLGDRVC